MNIRVAKNTTYNPQHTDCYGGRGKTDVWQTRDDIIFCNSTDTINNP